MPDPDILEWAARERRVVVTQDVNTLVGHAQRRVEAGLPMTGVIAIRGLVPIGQAVEEVEVLGLAGEEGDLQDLVIYITPLQQDAIT
jgi:hypothetical protein